MLPETKEDRKAQNVPGTEIMVDAGSHHMIKSAADRVLIRQPSSDPHDPLVWILVCYCTYSSADGSILRRTGTFFEKL